MSTCGSVVCVCVCVRVCVCVKKIDRFFLKKNSPDWRVPRRLQDLFFLFKLASAQEVARAGSAGVGTHAVSLSLSLSLLVSLSTYGKQREADSALCMQPPPRSFFLSIILFLQLFLSLPPLPLSLPRSQLTTEGRGRPTTLAACFMQRPAWQHGVGSAWQHGVGSSQCQSSPKETYSCQKKPASKPLCNGRHGTRRS